VKRSLVLSLAVVLALAGMTAGSAGCIRRVPRPIEDRATESSQTVTLDGAREVELTVEMGAGQLSVKSTDSTATAVAGDFESSPGNIKPAFSAATQGTTRHVRIDQPKVDFDFGSSGIKNRWTLSLPKGVPTMLALMLGAGQGDLDMRGVDLTALTVEQGAGNLKLDLSGQRRELTVMATLGAGEATFRVPRDVAVVFDDRNSGLGDLKADGFIQRPDGTWVNDAWASAYSEYATGPRTAPVIRLNVAHGLGDVRILTAD